MEGTKKFIVQSILYDDDNNNNNGIS